MSCKCTCIWFLFSDTAVTTMLRIMSLRIIPMPLAGSTVAKLQCIEFAWASIAFSVHCCLWTALRCPRTGWNIVKPSETCNFYSENVDQLFQKFLLTLLQLHMYMTAKNILTHDSLPSTYPLDICACWYGHTNDLVSNTNEDHWMPHTLVQHGQTLLSMRVLILCVRV